MLRAVAVICCSLLVDCWLRKVSTEARFFFTHADRSAGFELVRRATIERVKRAAAVFFFGGKLPEGKFLRARFCYTFNFGPFFVCCVEGLFVKLVLGV